MKCHQIALASAGVLATASAFVTPSGFALSKVNAPKASTSRSAMQMSYLDTAPGACAPFGFFDPLGLSNGKDDKLLRKFAEAEIKHGRVAMLASVGMLLQEGFHPFFLKGQGPLGPAINHFQLIEADAPYLAIVLVAMIGGVEAYTIMRGWSMTEKETGTPIAALNPDYTPGDLGFDPLGLMPSDAKGRYARSTKERNNGRLAMLAVVGIWAQELVQNKTIFASLFAPIIGGSS